MTMVFHKYNKHVQLLLLLQIGIAYAVYCNKLVLYCIIIVYTWLLRAVHSDVQCIFYISACMFPTVTMVTSLFCCNK